MYVLAEIGFSNSNVPAEGGDPVSMIFVSGVPLMNGAPGDTVYAIAYDNDNNRWVRKEALTDTESSALLEAGFTRLTDLEQELKRIGFGG